MPPPSSPAWRGSTASTRAAPVVLRVARTLGADVPFFLIGGAALMTGRGDVLEAALPAARSQIVLVKPQASVPTAAAYAAFDQAPAAAPGPAGVVSALSGGDSLALAEALSNNLTSASATLVPEVIDALAWLGEQPGVLGAAMAGSGSATFALCENAASARSIAEAARARGWWAVATETSPSGVRITDEDEGTA